MHMRIARPDAADVSLSSLAGNLASGDELTLTVRVGNPSASTDATSARSARTMLLDQR